MDAPKSCENCPPTVIASGFSDAKLYLNSGAKSKKIERGSFYLRSFFFENGRIIGGAPKCTFLNKRRA